MVPKARARELQVEQVGNVSVAQLPGPALLDAETIGAVGRQLAELVKGLGERPQLVLNFGQVEHLSSTMVGTVMKAHTRVAGADGRLALCGLRPSIADVFRITGLDRVLNIYPDEAAALQSF